MAALELELFVHDPLNPMVGGQVRVTADGEVAKKYNLTAAQYHYLLGAFLRETEDLVNGEGGR